MAPEANGMGKEGRPRKSGREKKEGSRRGGERQTGIMGDGVPIRSSISSISVTHS